MGGDVVGRCAACREAKDRGNEGGETEEEEEEGAMLLKSWSSGGSLGTGWRLGLRSACSCGGKQRCRDRSL